MVTKWFKLLAREKASQARDTTRAEAERQNTDRRERAAESARDASYERKKRQEALECLRACSDFNHCITRCSSGIDDQDQIIDAMTPYLPRKVPGRDF